MRSDLDDIRGDVQFEGFRWVNDYRNLILYLSPPALPGREAVVLELCCRCASDLEVAMDWRGNAVNAFSWDIEWQVVPGGRWFVRMNFEPHGSIQFQCDEVAVDGEVVRPNS